MIALPELVVLLFFFAVASSLFTCGFILTDRRRIGQRAAWALIALLLPLLGPILYFAFARIEVPRSAALPPPLPPPFSP